MAQPARGEVWWVGLSPARGRGQGGRRPGLVVSVDEFNQGPADLVVLVPLTTKRKGVPFHVEISPPEGGVDRLSYVKCEDLRTVSKARLAERLGSVDVATVAQVEDRLRILLGL